ncbi:MAG: N-6 DNA methylase [Mariprofundales bacterium]
MTTVRYNERAWAIDLISKINQLLITKQWSIKRAGGEHTLNSSTGRLFPDVLLFSDQQGLNVLQGWELKMPDTAITDIELLSNAEHKARQLGLNSFLVWNVNEAALFVQHDGKSFERYHHWEPLGINTRDEVHARQREWITLLEVIMKGINQFLKEGEIFSQQPVVAMNEHLFASIVYQHTGGVAEKICAACQKDAVFNAEIDEWWMIHKNEHEQSAHAHHVLAQHNIVSWLNRILFAHYLKPFSDAAKQIDEIVEATSISDAIDIFDNISAQCDFMNIFKPALAQTYLSNEVWKQIIAIHMFFADLGLDDWDQSFVHKLVELALLASRRKISGQFPTPKPLADLLARITVQDKNRDVFDPCCGTGTIARSCYQLKYESDISPKNAIATTWAADKFSFPLQLASIALSHPEAMGEIMHVFQHDLFDLSLPMDLSFTNPKTGGQIEQTLPKVHAIVSNLPFVRFETLATVNPKSKVFAEGLNETLGNERLPAKVDLYAYAVLKLWYLLENDGKVGVIISNAWLGASWGSAFRAAVLRYFKIDNIIISGSGRWFSNADVVTTILSLSKRAATVDAPSDDESIAFVQVQKPIDDWGDNNGLYQISNAILLKRSKADFTTVQQYALADVCTLETYGIGWSALFSDLSWFNSVQEKLCLVSTYLDVARGARRGWDAMFYPSKNHGIESQYIQPVLKTARSIKSLIATADAEAFCCSDDLTVMQSGARRWVSGFEHARNNRGKLLAEVLKRAHHYWYEMKSETMADLVLSMNWDRHLLVARLVDPTFVNQRLIRFTAKSHTNISIVHALLNTTLGLFLIESVGFGKGLGALDLNATNIRKNLHMLDPSLLNEVQVFDIIKAFKPLLGRDVLSVREELQQSDRLHFDKVVLQAFDLGGVQENISNALLALVEMRQAVHNG